MRAYRRTLLQTCQAALACAIVACSATLALGQNGVKVSPDGVFRTITLRDPGGRLHRVRMEAAVKALPADLAKSSKLRKISLNRLENAISGALARGEQLPDEVKYLAGLTRITHVFYLPETRDIVLAGPAEPFGVNAVGRPVAATTGEPVVELRDLITALRAYGPRNAGTDVISVSIDPTQSGLQKLQQHIATNAPRLTRRNIKQFTHGMQQALGKQNVRIIGIPSQSHFAQVLVEADYRMKLIGVGLEKPPVSIRSYVSHARPGATSRNSLQRWYFTPDYNCVRVTEDGFAMQLEGKGVKLISEDQLVGADGTRARTGGVDPASQAFAAGFTAKYSQLAAKEPVFGQMRNLIDLAIVSAFLQRYDYFGHADWDMELLGDESRLPVNTLTTPRQVETAVNAVWKGSTLMTPIGGGVKVHPRNALKPSVLLKDEGNKVSAIRQGIKTSQLEASQWWWD